MAKRKRKSRKKGKQSIPVAPIIPVAGVAFRAYTLAGGLNMGMVDRLGVYMTGYHPSLGTFSVKDAMPFWLGEVAAVAAHKVAQRTGINDYVRKATFGYLSI